MKALKFIKKKLLTSYLTKVDCYVYVIVFATTGQGRTLPPFFCSVDRIVDGVALVWVVGVAYVTDLPLVKCTTELEISSASQLTKKFRPIGTACRSCIDLFS